ncbi:MULTISPECIES: hypothetical protein [Bacillus cereus group]|uniref:hypothetical protein n=1 Tax=Bacillus cereus group TaxID=86661 RepID=UPI001F26A38D|nr:MULTISPECIES: hypothetical protein [Bacillus cereus group]MCE7037871.1 hypothetical protein [Bacillus cereus]
MNLVNNFMFRVKEYQAAEFDGEILKFKQAVGIGLYDLYRGVILPSPLTNFIKSVYGRRSQSLSSQRNAASEVCKFLNFVVERIKEKDKDFLSLQKQGIEGLTLLHGAKYISYQTIRSKRGEIKGSYVYRMESYLVEFYYWLKKQNLIEEDFELKHKLISYKGNARSVKVSPFNDLELGTLYPNRREENVDNRIVDFGKNRYNLAVKLIRIAEQIAEDIAFGVCLQLFGGLRKGEVVNLLKTSLKPQGSYGKSGLIIEIRDNRELIFPNKKSTIHEQVKNPRNQSVLISSLLSSLYQKHFEKLNKLEKIGLLKNNKALFISTRTGNPISGKQYYQKFNKVKNKFLEVLSKEGNTEDFEYLFENSWSTHICRGVFTNFLLDIGMSVLEIAIARGDRSLESALSYVEEKTALENMELAVNTLKQHYECKEASIAKTYINELIEAEAYE